MKEFWPFASLAQWQGLHHLRPAALPEYDPALVPPLKTTRRALAEVLGILAAILAAGALGLYWLFHA